jgi:hypothetical protein
VGVSRSGIFLRIIAALCLVIAVIVLPEMFVNKLLVAFSALLFLAMGGAIVVPWRRPDLLGWEFFGLFITLGVLFGVSTAQIFGYIPASLPFEYRAGIRASLVIFEAGVLTGLIRVTIGRRVIVQSENELMGERIARVEDRMTAEETRNDISEALSREAVARQDIADERPDAVEVQQGVQDERIETVEEVTEIKRTVTKKPDSTGPHP